MSPEVCVGFFDGRLAHRVLRAYSSGDSRDRLDGTAYASRNKLDVLLGEQLVVQLRGARVLGLGYGDGQITGNLTVL